ncbi:MAG TPA: DinB family protein [Gemmatimonadales bacterium]|nr:DinB family protein [Gemmatimonadales bacterium]
MMTVNDILQELEQEAQATRRVLERLPDNRLQWKPHPKSMSLGQLALHVANIPGRIAEISTAAFDASTPIPRPEADSTAQVLEAFEASMVQARQVLRTMTDSELSLPWRMMQGDRELWSIPRGAFLRSVMLNHWYHHRGQLTVYLRQNGASLPAVYGDSADERVMPG